MTSTALAIANPQNGTLAIHGAHQAMTMDRDALRIIQDSMMRGSSEVELLAFIKVCEATRLNPLVKQIHAVPRWQYDKDLKRSVKVWSYQTSIDGFRLIAERTGAYEGQTAPSWCGIDGVWRDVWLETTPPAAARVGVWRRGFREPAMGVATFDQYKQTNTSGELNPMWQKMGAHMLAKCAEAQALRKAFPQELSGLYTDDEMGQADAREPAPAAATPVTGKPATSLDVMKAMREWTGLKPGADLNAAIADFGRATGVVAKGGKLTADNAPRYMQFIEWNKHRDFTEAIRQPVDGSESQEDAAPHEDAHDNSTGDTTTP